MAEVEMVLPSTDRELSEMFLKIISNLKINGLKFLSVTLIIINNILFLLVQLKSSHSF